MWPKYYEQIDYSAFADIPLPSSNKIDGNIEFINYDDLVLEFKNKRTSNKNEDNNEDNNKIQVTNVLKRLFRNVSPKSFQKGTEYTNFLTFCASMLNIENGYSFFELALTDPLY